MLQLNQQTCYYPKLYRAERKIKEKKSWTRDFFTADRGYISAECRAVVPLRLKPHGLLKKVR
jgi:hypothetical protein